MRKFFVTLMTSLLGCATAFAFFPEAVDSSLELGVGYRNDKIKWKNSANSFLFNGNDSTAVGIPARFRSEIEWRNLDIWQLSARGKYVTCDNLYLRGYADYGWITHGRVRDSDDCSLASRCNESYDFVRNAGFAFTRHNGRSRHGHVYDLSGAIGYQFKLCDDSMSLSPIVGYSWHGQHLQFKRRNECGGYTYGCNDSYGSDYTYYDSYSDSSDSCYSSGSSCESNNHLSSRTRIRWNGPFVGIDLDYRFCCDWTFFADYEFHWARYHASGRWNRFEDFANPIRFRQHARSAHGQIASVGVKWDFCDCWTLGIRGDFQCWRSRHGREKVKISENDCGSIEQVCYNSVPLKRVTWESAAVTIDIGMVF